MCVCVYWRQCGIWFAHHKFFLFLQNPSLFPESNLHYNGQRIKMQKFVRFTMKIIFNFDERLIGVSKMLLLRLTKTIDMNAPHTN